MFDEYYRRTWVDSDGDISPRQSELATSLRVPILTSAWPRWSYITGIVVCDGEDSRVGIMPTDDEIRLVGAHLATYNRYYRESFLEAMKQFAPYDIDGGANLGYYLKRPDGGWCYRKRTWRSGGTWWPRNWVRDDDSEMHKRCCSRPLPLSHVLARNFNGWSFTRREAASV